MDKLKIPVPDPLGILGQLTKNMPVQLYDPVSSAGEIKESSVKDKSYIDDQIKMYKHHLEQALRYAPCPGCRKLVISALVGVEIYREMDDKGLGRDDITDEEVNRIRKEVEMRYGA